MQKKYVIWYKHPNEKWRRYLSCNDCFSAEHVAQQQLLNVSPYYKLGITVLILPPSEHPIEKDES